MSILLLAHAVKFSSLLLLAHAVLLLAHYC